MNDLMMVTIIENLGHSGEVKHNMYMFTIRKAIYPFWKCIGFYVPLLKTLLLVRPWQNNASSHTCEKPNISPKVCCFDINFSACYISVRKNMDDHFLLQSIVVLVTDGESNIQANETIPQAERMHEAGITVS